MKVSGFLDEFEKDEIKKRVDILSLFSSFGVSYEKKGRSHMAKCPWHDDDTPSLSIDQGKGLYNCFGCGESGDIFDLVQKMEGIDFKDSLKYLKEFDGSIVPFSKTLEVPAEPVPSESHQPEGGSFEGVDLERVMEFYRKSLSTSEEAVSYFDQRGIDRKVLSRFGCGYASGKLRSMVSDEQFKELKQAGVFNEKGYESFKDCVVIPLLDSAGKAVGLYGRKISPTAKVKHLYLKGPHRGLLNRKAAAVYREEVILTESVIDALSLIQMGIENVIPCYGANGFTEEHLSLLHSERVKLVTIAFDNDDSGRAAAEKLIESLLAEGFPVKVIAPPEVKDWNELLTLGSSVDEIKRLLETADVIYPPGKSPDFYVTRENGKYTFEIDQIIYRVLGVKEVFISNLRVNIRSQFGEDVFLDNVDLYSSRSRTSYAVSLASRFSLEVKKIEKSLMRIVEYLEEMRDEALNQAEKETSVPSLTEEEKRIGLEFLRSEDLFDQIVSDLETIGYVGEDLNKLLMYLAATSRKLDDPISILVLSQSASGKSMLVDAVSRLIPPEDLLQVSSLSDQALNYVEEGGLVHKFLVMGEAVHSDVVEYQIREMLSARQLSRLITTKDEKTGQMVSKKVEREVIVASVMSSTNTEVNPENASRCFLLNADETDEQTVRIHERQRQKYSLHRTSEKRKTVPEIVKKHISAQRLLEKKMIVNPYGEHLDFPSRLMRSRRDNDRFIDLIATVCFLRQYQKEVKIHEEGNERIEYIECDLKDYGIAYRIMTENLLKSMLLEITPSDEKLYEAIREMAKDEAKSQNLKVSEVGFTQRQIREFTGLGQSWVKQHLRTLVELEYLMISGGGRSGSRNTYRLRSDEKIGVVDVSVIPTPDAIEKILKKRV
nr:CHC2 zinc finger domain-containing protein [Spirochaeta isovalerica]